MQRYHQGQLDFFCAAYAVINAMTALYGINLSQARALLASVLADISRHPDLWQAALCNETDFHWLADYMLFACNRSSSYPVRVFRPFVEPHEIPENAVNLENAKPYTSPSAKPNSPDPDIIWATLENWLPNTPDQPRAGSARRVALLRFHRYICYMEKPVVSHWSMTDCHYEGVFTLRDASKEENALYSLDRDMTVFEKRLVSGKFLVRIEPESIYFIGRK